MIKHEGHPSKFTKKLFFAQLMTEIWKPVFAAVSNSQKKSFTGYFHCFTGLFFLPYFLFKCVLMMWLMVICGFRMSKIALLAPFPSDPLEQRILNIVPCLFAIQQIYHSQVGSYGHKRMLFHSANLFKIQNLHVIINYFTGF